MEDKELRQVLSATKLKADEQLKSRIIHQIHAEKALIPAKQKSDVSTNENHLSLLGTMYAMLLSLIAYFYIKTDGNPFESSAFVLFIIFTAATFSMYWLLIVYTDYRKLKS